MQQFLLPKPSSIASSFWDDRHTLWPAGWYTFKEALGGFVGGSLLGMLAATAIGHFRTLGAALLPLAVAANAVPVIAFAPIFNAWFDPLSPHSKMAIAGVLCFVPVLVNTLRGLQSASPRQLELMRSYAAGELEIWRRVRVPSALPYVFTALKVASVLAMIGAIVGEYFGGAFNALGVLIRSDAQVFNFQRAWAGILVASLLGLVVLRGGRDRRTVRSCAGRRRLVSRSDSQPARVQVRIAPTNAPRSNERKQRRREQV